MVQKKSPQSASGRPFLWFLTEMLLALSQGGGIGGLSRSQEWWQKNVSMYTWISYHEYCNWLIDIDSRYLTLKNLTMHFSSSYYSALIHEASSVNDKKPQPGLNYGRIRRAPRLPPKKEKSTDTSSSSRSHKSKWKEKCNATMSI